MLKVYVSMNVVCTCKCVYIHVFAAFSYVDLFSDLCFHWFDLFSVESNMTKFIDHTATLRHLVQ